MIQIEAPLNVSHPKEVFAVKKKVGSVYRKHLAVCSILAAATLWGVQGLFSRALGEMNIPGLPIMVVRNLGGAALLALVFLAADRTAFRVRLRELPLLALMGMSGVLGMNLVYYRSQQVSSLAVAAILLYTAPTIVVVFSALIWKDRITKRKLLALVLAFLGCGFVSGMLHGALSISTQGLLLGLGSALTYASYTLFGRKALTWRGPLTVLFYALLFAGLGALVLCPAQEMAMLFTTSGAMTQTFCMMVFSTVVPFLLYTKGLAGLGDSGKAAILASLEPVVAALLGIVAFGEPLTLGVALGLVCVLGAVALLK
jgi:drug/metabolite transporter, DME family